MSSTGNPESTTPVTLRSLPKRVRKYKIRCYPRDALVFEIKDGLFHLGGMELPMVEGWNLEQQEYGIMLNLKIRVSLPEMPGKWKVEKNG